MTRKLFECGAKVEVQREVDVSWELGEYIRPIPTMRGWHMVELSPEAEPKVITIGPERSMETRRIMVPSRRLRKFGHPHGARRP